MEIHRSILIDAEPREVFKLIGDPRRYPDFFVGITKWEPRSRKRKGVDARYRVLMQVGAIEAGGTLRVTDWDEPNGIAWTSEQGIHQSGRWGLRPVPDGTELTLEVEYDLSGGPVGSLVARLAGRIVGRNIWATLLAARRLLELESATA